MEHRDQGATRGQQQPSSLQRQPPTSLAITRGEDENKQEADELEEEDKQKKYTKKKQKTKNGEEHEEEEDLTRGVSASLLPPR